MLNIRLREGEIMKVTCEKQQSKVIDHVNCSYFDPKMCPYFKNCKMGYIKKAQEVKDAGTENIIIH